MLLLTEEVGLSDFIYPVFNLLDQLNWVLVDFLAAYSVSWLDLVWIISFLFPDLFAFRHVASPAFPGKWKGCASRKWLQLMKIGCTC